MSTIPDPITLERYVLGALIREGDKWSDVKSILNPGHFVDKLHAEIFRTIGQMNHIGIPVDVTTVGMELIESRPYITELAVKSTGASNIVYYAGKVAEAGNGRKAQTLNSEIGVALSKGECVKAKVAKLDRLTDAVIGESPLDILMGLSTTNKLEEMRANMKKDTWVFQDMALDGQITQFYALPNAGKTLFFMRFIVDAIRDGRLIKEKVLYINADDNYRGLMQKTEIAAEYGFNMISPEHSGMTPADVTALLIKLAVTEESEGQIIILDTLKKFVDLMNKNAQKPFYEALRTLTTRRNATVILAGHANKYPDAEGNLIFEGVQDIKNDIDCMYSINVIERIEDKTIVEFRREKERGDNILKVSYSYEKIRGLGYRALMDSITMLSDIQATKAAHERHEQEIRDRYESELIFLRTLLANGAKNQAEILKEHAKKSNPLSEEFSVRELKSAMKALIGMELTVERGEKNANVYDIIGGSAERYRSVKQK